MNKILIGLLLLTVFSCGKNDELYEANRFFNQGEFSKAIDVYSQYIKTNPSDIPAIYNRGRAYEESQQYKNALNDFYTVLSIDNNHVQANMSIAQDFYFRQEEYSRSVKYINNALEKDKNNTEAYTLRGKVFQHLGNLEKALNDYNNAINIDNKNPEAYYARGSLFLSTKKNKKACQDFDMARILGSKEAEKVLEKYCR